MIKRRNFISLVGGAAVAWPLAARAQQPTLPVVGFLSAGAIDAYSNLLNAFREGLKQTGYVEGKNVAIEARGERFDRTQQLAAELVQHGIAVIVASGETSALAARSVSTTVPLVFVSQADPVQFGLVASLSHPGGNATGVALLATDLVAKRFGMVRQLAPTGASIAVLVNPKTPAERAGLQAKELEDAARSTGQRIQILDASNPSEIDAAFSALAQLHPGALIVSTDPYLFSERNRIQALAARNGIPTIYDRREFVDAGGLMSYGTHYADAFRQIGVYAGKILRGAKPADLPVEQVARFELVINLKTAKALGLDVPPNLLALADEVIE
jgi:putative tryptophan/tyrosine transport system substrate-binding protein